MRSSPSVTVDGKDALCRRMYPRQDRGEWRVDRLAGESQVLTEGLRLELPTALTFSPSEILAWAADNEGQTRCKRRVYTYGWEWYERL
jgi:phage tail protein X